VSRLVVQPADTFDDISMCIGRGTTSRLTPAVRLE